MRRCSVLKIIPILIFLKDKELFFTTGSPGGASGQGGRNGSACWASEWKNINLKREEPPGVAAKP